MMETEIAEKADYNGATKKRSTKRRKPTRQVTVRATCPPRRAVIVTDRRKRKPAAFV